MKTWPPYTRHERISGIVRSQPIKDAIIPTLCKTVHNFFGNRFKVWKHLLKLSEWLTQKGVKYLPGINLAPWNWHIKMAIPMKKLYFFFEKLKKLNKVKNNIFFARQVSRTKLSNLARGHEKCHGRFGSLLFMKLIDWLVWMLGWNWKISLVIIESQKNLQKT